MKDYNKHWLIQEAEQRRISEAKQKQNLSTSSSSTNTSTNTSQGQIDKLENINNNHRGFGEKRVNNTISDNIYANVDPSNISYSSDPRWGWGSDQPADRSGLFRCMFWSLAGF